MNSFRETRAKASIRRLLGGIAIALLGTAGIAAHAAGERLLVGNHDGVLEFDGHTGAFVRQFVADGLGGLSGVQNLTLGPDGNVYVSSWNTAQVLRYDGQTGAFMDVFVHKGVGGLSNPDQVVFGPDGNLYVSDRFSARVLRYNGHTGHFIDTFVQDGRLGGFVAFTFGPDGDLYASEFNSNQQVLRFDGTTGAFIEKFTHGHRVHFSALSGLAFKDGRLYASRFHGDCVQVFDGTTGDYLGRFVKVGAGGLDVPDYLAFGPDGNLYVDAQGTGAVMRYDGSTGEFIDQFAKIAGMEPKGLVFVDAPPAR